MIKAKYLAQRHRHKPIPLRTRLLTDMPSLLHRHPWIRPLPAWRNRSRLQKAVGAMKSMRKVLKKIPELKFELIESSYCGMAGSFRIEKEHTDISMKMAELSLLPTIRNNPEARVLANGFSCRHQIREGSERHSIHLAVLLRGALA